MVSNGGGSPGTSYKNTSQQFWFTNQSWLGNAPAGSTWKVLRNGVDSIDASDDIRQHMNLVQCQKICYGGVKLHHHGHDDPAILWDFPIAA